MRKHVIAYLGLGLALALQPIAALAQQAAPAGPPEGYYYRPGPWNMMWNDGYGWHAWWMFPMMLLFVLLVCGVAFALYHGLSRRAGWRSDAAWDDPALSALKILNERFARGEIQRDEYEDKKAALLFGGRR
jgi:putative membrane protein